MSIQKLGEIATGYSQSMDNISTRLADPTLIQDPARLAQFQIEMYFATTGYQLTSRTIQDIHREDNLLTELLRDA